MQINANDRKWVTSHEMLAKDLYIDAYVLCQSQNKTLRIYGIIDSINYYDDHNKNIVTIITTRNIDSDENKYRRSRILSTHQFQAHERFEKTYMIDDVSFVQWKDDTCIPIIRVFIEEHSIYQTYKLCETNINELDKNTKCSKCCLAGINMCKFSYRITYDVGQNVTISGFLPHGCISPTVMDIISGTLCIIGYVKHNGDEIDLA